MENRKDPGVKQIHIHNKTEEQQNTSKQLLGFDEVNFEQIREPYHETTNRNRHPSDVPDRWRQLMK